MLSASLPSRSEVALELSLIVTAVRRRPWLPVVLALLGLLAATQLRPDRGPALFDASATLLVQPPTSSGAQVFNAEPDRYVISQLPAIRSLADRVAAQFPGLAAATLGSRLDVVHEPQTDLVTVTVSDPDPARAANIANKYVDMYIEDLGVRATSARSGEIDALDQQLTALEASLKEVAKKIKDTTTTPDPRNAPSVTIVGDTDALVQQQILTAEYQGVLSNRNQLELQTNLKVNSEVISYATVPTVAESDDSRLLLAVGFLVGGLLGVGLATVWTNLSPLALSRDDVEAALKHPLVGRVPKIRSARRHPSLLLVSLPKSVEDVVDQLRVSSEAHAGIAGSVSVAVVGTQRCAGSTTVALALAGRFAASGARVALIDADAQRADLTLLFDAAAHGGIPSLLAGEAGGSEVDNGARRRGRRPRGAYASTNVTDVSLLGHGPRLDQPAMHRSDAPRLVAAVTESFQAAVVDAGSLLDSALAQQLASNVDAVVVCVPLRDQRVDRLHRIERLLSDLPALVLPVLTDTRPGLLTRLSGRTGLSVGAHPLTPAEPDEPARQPESPAVR